MHYGVNIAPIFTISYCTFLLTIDYLMKGIKQTFLEISVVVWRTAVQLLNNFEIEGVHTQEDAFGF